MKTWSNFVNLLKAIFRKWPPIYELARRIYYWLNYLFARWIVGSKLNDWKWMHKNDISLNEFAESILHPHRDYFLKRVVSQSSSFQSVLEIGCNAGQNLRVLAERYPNVLFYGIDINPHFIEKGKEWLAKDSITNVRLQEGNAGCLTAFNSRSIDITFSDAILIYLGPDRIDQAIQEMIRVTRKAILFNEWSLEMHEPNKLHEWFYGHWVHNYRALLSKYVPTDRIHTSKIPQNHWDKGGGWERYGTLIIVNLED